MRAEPISTLPLENGLTLRLFDLSRPVATDRWYIGVVGEVAVVPSQISMVEMPEDLLDVVGDQVVFHQKRERHFIDDKEMTAAKEGMIRSLTETLVPYLSHPDFPRRLIRKTYLDTLKRYPRQQPRGL
jgi:hypothetical protein